MAGIQDYQARHLLKLLQESQSGVPMMHYYTVIVQVSMNDRSLIDSENNRQSLWSNQWLLRNNIYRITGEIKL